MTGACLNHFDTFKRNILIYKEPLKILSRAYNQTNFYAGYEEQSEPDAITYSGVSGTFSALVDYGRNERNQRIDVANTQVTQETLRIKVREDARNFIRNGKTEKIEFDNNSFNIVGEEVVQNYMGLAFYFYTLKLIK